MKLACGKTHTYALVTAGESLHWMEWDVVLPRLVRVLTPHGMLAIAFVEEEPAPWSEGYRQISQHFTDNPTNVLLMYGGKSHSIWVDLAMGRLATVLPRSETDELAPKV